jgi:tetratricopeptide (TPR) repeat protein
MFHRKACSLLIGCFWFIISAGFAQEQKIADSLARIYQQDTLTGIAKFELLTDLSFNEVKDLKKGLKYAEELISLAGKTGDNKYLRSGYFLKGNKERSLGNLDQALEAYIKSAEIASGSQNFAGEAEAFSAIADIYSVANNHPNAMAYYNKAITSLRRSITPPATVRRPPGATTRRRRGR